MDIRRYLERHLGKPTTIRSTALRRRLIGGGHNGLTAAFYLARAGL